MIAAPLYLWDSVKLINTAIEAIAVADSLKWLECFVGGKRTSSSGFTREYTSEDLDQVVETYNPDHFRAPLIVSTPAHNTAGYADDELHKSQLAFGYPERLKRVGDRLLAGFKVISPKIKEWIDGGGILGFSSSFYLPTSPHNPYPGKWALRHIAGCGVDPPAVKGMALPAFAEPLSDFVGYSEDVDEEDAIEFSLDVDEETLRYAAIGSKIYAALQGVAEASFCDGAGMSGMSSIAQILKKYLQMQRDMAIEADGVEAANSQIPSFWLDQLSAIAMMPMPMKQEDDEEGGDSEGYSEERESEESEDFQEDDQMSQELENRIAALERENADLRAARELERVTNFCEGLVRDRKLLPANKDAEIQFILTLEGSNTASYSELGEMTPRDAYMKRLANGPALWSNERLPIAPGDAPPSFSEIARYSEGSNPELNSVDRKIRDRCTATNRNPEVLSHYEGAWNELIREGVLADKF